MLAKAGSQLRAAARAGAGGGGVGGGGGGGGGRARGLHKAALVSASRSRQRLGNGPHRRHPPTSHRHGHHDLLLHDHHDQHQPHLLLLRRHKGPAREHQAAQLLHHAPEPARNRRTRLRAARTAPQHHQRQHRQPSQAAAKTAADDPAGKHQHQHQQRRQRHRHRHRHRHQHHRHRHQQRAHRSTADLESDLLTAFKAVAAGAPKVMVAPFGKHIQLLVRMEERAEAEGGEGVRGVRGSSSLHHSRRRMPTHDPRVHHVPLGGGSDDDDASPAVNHIGLRFSAAGRLVLGLGTIGVFGHSLEAASSSALRDPLPFKKRLFRNLNEMFALDERRAAANRAAAAASAVSPSSAAGAAAAAGLWRREGKRARGAENAAENTNRASPVSTRRGFATAAAASAAAAAAGSSTASRVARMAREAGGDRSGEAPRPGSAGRTTAGAAGVSPPSCSGAGRKAAAFERLVQGDRLVLREGDITADQFRALDEFLASCPHIRSLRLQGIEITAGDVDKLGSGLREIRHITFCDNSIGLNEGSLERLVALLLCCGLLESTSILRNSISDDHVPHLEQLLRRHQNLGHLSLAWNGIRNDGARRMASVLENLRTSFHDLDLTFNCVGEEGRSALEGVGRHRRERFGTDAAQIRITLLGLDRFRRAEGFDTDDPGSWCHVDQRSLPGAAHEAAAGKACC